jgi:hypothetical protein
VQDALRVRSPRRYVVRDGCVVAENQLERKIWRAPDL